jgi:hypothetical protein
MVFLQTGKIVMASIQIFPLFSKSNSNSLTNQPGIYLILVNKKNYLPTVWQMNLAK